MVNRDFETISQWLAQKRLVIIGGTTGLGLSAAKAFVQKGASVIVVGRDVENGRLAEAELQGKGIAISGDATDPATARTAIERCQQALGGFDGLYHVAGGSGRRYGDGPLHELTPAGWNYTVALNLTSLMLSNQAAVQALLAQRTGGSILNMGSVLGYSPSPAHFSTHAYAATKSAVIGFTKSIAAYYAPNNIRINVLAPALVETPMAQRAANDDVILSFIQTKQPLAGGCIGQPGDLDGAAVYFLSDASAFTTGHVLSVDGGWNISEGQI